MSVSESVTRATGAIARQLDRWRLPILTTIAAGWFLVMFLLVQVKPFWHDEVYTVLVARLPYATMWRAYLDAIDLSPPLNTMVTRPISLLAGEGPVLSRLPAIFGYIVTSVTLFAFVRRRSNAIVGFTAALIPAVTVAWDYAQEARGYGLTMACFAVALFGWSEAAAGRRRTLHLTMMAVALAAGMWTHYYFALAFVPIALGELTRQVAQRRIDWTPWLAIAAACVAVLPLFPLTAVASAQRTTFWARPKTIELGNAYGFILGQLASGQTGRLLALVSMPIAAIGAVLAHARSGSRRRLATHDLVACVVCLLVPAGGVTLGFLTGAFADRYVVYSVVGLLAAMPLLVWSFAPDNRIVEVFALVATMVVTTSTVRTSLADRKPWHDYLTDRPILTDWFKSGKQIVVTGAIDYLPIWYYTPAEAQARLKYLADPAGQMDVMGTDTVDRGYLALARWLPVPVVPIAAFGLANPSFYLYAPGRDDSWTERRIRSWSATIQYFGLDAGGRLYEIKLPEDFGR